MEASFFRRLARELGAALTGRRIEKIHGPAEGVLALTFSPQGPGSGKLILIFRPAKTAGLLFVSPERPANPLTAPARVMWLRKRAQGRRLLRARADWPNLRLAFELNPREVPAAGRWLVLDLREGLILAEDFPEVPEAAWPPLARILAEPEIWREFPQLTPLLRRRLAALHEKSPAEAQALLDALARPEDSPCGPLFLAPGDRPPLAWDEGLPGTETFPSAGEAATAHGLRTLFPQLARLEQKEALEQAQAEEKRLRRRLKLLADDQDRHARLAALSTAAEALQAALSGLGQTPRADSVLLEHPTKGPVEVPLDPRLSPSENMARLFKLAAKGRRGLEHARRRASGLREELAESPVVPARQASADTPKPAPQAELLPKRYQGLAVALFRTSDGFTAVRGKSQQANHDILSKAASPFDYWLHVAGGPSAHVILRRDHPDQQVPEQSLVEAATLCALRSWRKDDSRADVLLAKVKDVRKIKGAAIGSVAVDEVERVLRVELGEAAAGLEERLALHAATPQDGRPCTPPSSGRAGNSGKAPKGRTRR